MPRQICFVEFYNCELRGLAGISGGPIFISWTRGKKLSGETQPKAPSSIVSFPETGFQFSATLFREASGFKEKKIQFSVIQIQEKKKKTLATFNGNVADFVSEGRERQVELRSTLGKMPIYLFVTVKGHQSTTVNKIDQAQQALRSGLMNGALLGALSTPSKPSDSGSVPAASSTLPDAPDTDIQKLTAQIEELREENNTLKLQLSKSSFSDLSKVEAELADLHTLLSSHPLPPLSDENSEKNSDSHKHSIFEQFQKLLDAKDKQIEEAERKCGEYEMKVEELQKQVHALASARPRSDLEIETENNLLKRQVLALEDALASFHIQATVQTAIQNVEVTQAAHQRLSSRPSLRDLVGGGGGVDPTIKRLEHEQSLRGELKRAREEMSKFMDSLRQFSTNVEEARRGRGEEEHPSGVPGEDDAEGSTEPGELGGHSKFFDKEEEKRRKSITDGLPSTSSWVPAPAPRFL